VPAAPLIHRAPEGVLSLGQTVFAGVAIWSLWVGVRHRRGAVSPGRAVLSCPDALLWCATLEV
jgi:hypothetical protein